MKSIITFIILGWFCLYPIGSIGQMKNLYPILGDEPDLSPQVFLDYKKLDKIYKKINTNQVSYESLTQNEKALVLKYELYESPWDILEGGCSWYCGGGPNNVKASSSLPAYKDITYRGDNAHDLSFETAWVEGIEGNGVGEYLLYEFSPNSPRITKVQIYNGYVKSHKAWEDNGRVKALKMYLNNDLYAILHLQDTKAEQVFEIEPLGQMESRMTLKFEIADVYPGNKYQDVAITEIFFDGIDVHCFAEGTQILMANGQTKDIELLKIGDEVISYNSQTQSLETSKVLELANTIHCEMLELIFEDGQSIITTADHPFLTKDHQWGSFDPEKTLASYGYEKMMPLERESKFYGYHEKNLIPQKINGINLIQGYHQRTYTIIKLEKGDTFFANGLAVGIERLKQKNLLPISDKINNKKTKHTAQN